MPPDIGGIRRRTIIDIARRRQKPGTGSLLPVEAKRMASDWPDLTGTLGELHWAVVGAMAANRYMPARATQDLDIGLLGDELPPAEQRLLSAGYKRLGALSIGGSTWQTPDGRTLDLVHLDRPWAREALEEAERSRQPDDLAVLTLPFLVIMKLEASRSIDIGDVSRMLGSARDSDLSRVREAITRYEPGMSNDLENLIELGRLEMQPPTEPRTG